MKQRADRMRLISIIGLALGGLLIVGGMVATALTGLGLELFILGVIVLGLSVVLLGRSRHAGADDAVAERRPEAATVERWYNPSNVYQRFLLYVGGAMLLIGGASAIAFKTTADEAVSSAEIQAIILSQAFVDASAGQLHYQWMWGSVAVAILGALMLVAYIAARANTNTEAAVTP